MKPFESIGGSDVLVVFGGKTKVGGRFLEVLLQALTCRMGNTVLSKNTNVLKIGAPGRFGLEVSRLGWQWKLESSVMRTLMQLLTWLVVAIASWTQRDQRADIVYPSQDFKNSPSDTTGREPETTWRGFVCSLPRTTS